ncbi:hypothetical protein AUJ83_02370 [Candidatus Woesearchaeota archaeon CG1_02_33_12]|nr:MAG: hypothetical protein AUJ83_02370 [Candidatus Woesearchaeota archaeon CG1_02_33_12]PIN77569.1 MAG: hypothetical protein COV14_05470 [Candidatus Woesearchaeota archaeon CG10_big_fil_rev_8_21_14_0_10_33_12]
MVNFGEAIKRPFQDFKKLGIGALMYMIPWVSIITGFFSSGYGLECAKTAIKKKPNLPEWSDWGNLWIRGFLMFLISVIYFLPLALLSVLFVGPLILKIMGGILSSNPETFIEGLGSAGNTLAFLGLLAVLIVYVLPMAIMFFVEKWNFSDAFKIGDIFKKAFTSKYFVAWIILIVYAMVIGLIISSLAAVTTITVIIPLILMGFWNMTLTITAMTVFGEVYSEIK